MIKVILVTMLIAGVCPAHAAELYASYESKDLKVKGEFSVELGKSITVSGLDNANQPYSLRFTTKSQGKDFVYLSYILSRGHKIINSASVVTKIGNAGEVSSGDEAFKAKLTL